MHAKLHFNLEIIINTLNYAKLCIIHSITIYLKENLIIDNDK